MRKKKIAFLFNIYDKINHEEIWKCFFDKARPEQYSVYIHHKYLPKLQFFNKFVIPSIITKWGDISMIKAQNRLLEYALKDSNNYKFIFVSGSCIPIKTFNYVYQKLAKENKSYFNMVPDQQCFPRLNRLKKILPMDVLKKSHQWCILNRKTAKALLKMPLYLEWFKNIKAPDEHAYISMIHYLNLQDEIINKGTTFVNWSENKLTLLNILLRRTKHPKTYSEIARKDLQKILNGPYLFARKFEHACMVINNDAKQKLADLMKAFLKKHS